MMQEIVHPRCLKCHAGDVLVPMSTIRGELKRPPQVVGLCFTFPQWQELKDHSTTLKQVSYGHSMRVKTTTTKVKVNKAQIEAVPKLRSKVRAARADSSKGKHRTNEQLNENSMLKTSSRNLLHSFRAPTRDAESGTTQSQAENDDARATETSLLGDESDLGAASRSRPQQKPKTEAGKVILARLLNEDSLKKGGADAKQASTKQASRKKASAKKDDAEAKKDGIKKGSTKKDGRKKASTRKVSTKKVSTKKGSTKKDDAVAEKGSTKKGSTKKGGAVAKKGSTTKGSTKNGSTQKGSTQKGRTEAKKDSSNTDIIILSSNIPSDDSIQPGLVLNSENIPQCDLTGCKDITVKSLNANQTVGITKLTVTLNEASIRLRPFTVVVFRQLVDSQVFLMDEEPKGPPQSRTTKVLAPQATEDSPESPVEETVEDQSLDNEATVLTTADDEASLSQIEVSRTPLKLQHELANLCTTFICRLHH